MSKPMGIEFIESLQLPDYQEYEELTATLKAVPSEAPKAVDNVKSANVVKSSLTSFTQNLTGGDKQDVQNSTLLAQLAADKKHKWNDNPKGWYDSYLDVLKNVGWNVPAFDFDNYSASGSSVNIDKAIIGILQAIATQNEIAIITETMGALQKLSGDSKAMNIWNANAQSGNKGNFQVFPVDSLPNGDLVMILTGIQFSARTSHGGFLWWSWKSSNIDIQRAVNKCVLNKDIYNKVRQPIIEKLGNRAISFVADIEI